MEVLLKHQFFLLFLVMIHMICLYAYMSTAGQHISRQISRSLMAQPSITEYNKFFRYGEGCIICLYCYSYICLFIRLNSNREDGIIQMKIGASSESWDSKWCVFEEGVLKHAPYIESKTISESSFDLIPMDKVIKLRTDVSTHKLESFVNFT